VVLKDGEMDEWKRRWGGVAIIRSEKWRGGWLSCVGGGGGMVAIVRCVSCGACLGVGGGVLLAFD
jgi:hypothetical protein